MDTQKPKSAEAGYSSKNILDAGTENGRNEPQFLPITDSWFGKPVEEVDPFVKEDTFCVISKKFDRHHVYRFSSSKSLFLLGPVNPIRKFAIYVTTHRYFDILIILTILANCITLAMLTNKFEGENTRVRPSYEVYVESIENCFLAIYTLEMILKVLSKGFMLNKFSYLRNRWNILDLIVVSSGYATIIFDAIGHDDERSDNSLDFLRTFRVLRVVKTVSILPGLRMMINALLSSVVQLVEVMALTMVCLMIFSLFALEVFRGKLRQKCVKIKGGSEDKERNTPIDIEPEEDRDRLWTMWVSDHKNWKQREFPTPEATQCGNGSDTRTCPVGYVCIPNLGMNPDLGWTSFDSFLGSMLSTFQLLTLDYWERLYDLVVSTCGTWSVLFFLIVIFLGAYYLLNLMLAVVALSYENEAQRQGQAPSLHNYRLATVRQNSNFSFDDLSTLKVCKMTHYRKRTKSERLKLAKRMKIITDEDEAKSEAHLGDTVFSILGMKMTHQEDDKSNKEDVSHRESTVEVPEEHHPVAAIDAMLKENADVESVSVSNSVVEIEISENYRMRLNRDRSSYKVMMARLAFWLRTRLRPIVNHKAFEIFITICIIANTIVLAMEHHGASKQMEEGLKIGNHLFMAIFTAECIVKLLALQREYCQIGWNIFDAVIVAISFLELAFDEAGGSVLSVIRSMRLLRVFKLAQSWITMKVLINIIFSSFGALGNLTCVLLIVIYIFAVMGMQIVGSQYTPAVFHAVTDKSYFPRWHWRHFWYAFMMVFRVLCGEWIEPLFECLQAQENSVEEHESKIIPYTKCFSLFMSIVIVGNFIVLNLFLALLLNSFDTQELNAQREKELEAKGRVENLKTIFELLKNNPHDKGPENEDTEGKDKNESNTGAAPNLTASKITISTTLSSTSISVLPSSIVIDSKMTLGRNKRFKTATKKILIQKRKEEAERAIARVERKVKKHGRDYFFLKNPTLRGHHAGLFDHDITPETSVDSQKLTDAGDCCPSKCYSLKCCNCVNRRTRLGRRCHYQNWNQIRNWCVTIISHPAFEWTILVLIFASSVTLCFEDIHLENNPDLQRTLCSLNWVFTAIFLTEMIIKWMAIGMWGYFTNFWTMLDAFIVSVSLVSIYFDIVHNACSTSSGKPGAVSNLAALKALRTLRALRPLRAISRWQGMKIVVNALMYAIPSIFNVLLVCLLFWLVFSIMGVQFFKGQFYHCVDQLGHPVEPSAAPNKDVCCGKAYTHGYSWLNSISNFDNVFEGYLSLLQVATFEGWMELMQSSVDAVGVDKQPVRDNRIGYYAFYVVFIIFGSFFTLQLFIGVIIDNFNMLKKKYEGNMLELLLTPTQRKYYIAMKNSGKKKPKKVLTPPSEPFIRFFYDLAMSRRLEIFIFLMILTNMAVEAFEQYGQKQMEIKILKGFSAFFTTIYLLEAIIKIVGLRLYYFTVPWNVFDFVIVIASMMDEYSLTDLHVAFPIPPTMLRIVRIFRIGRILRLVKAAKGIRKLMFALVVSLPALFNIGALLALITFIYAILGMALFSRAPKMWSVDIVFNFETFLNSCLMLLRLMTAAGWNEVLDSLTVNTAVCGTYRHLKCGLPDEPECPNRALVIAYIVSYLVITYLIVINLYIAIILENYVDATNEEDIGIVEDDLELFYVRWSRFDPMATQFIHFVDLSDFLDDLGPPLGIPKPNTVAIAAFNLPICRGNKIHCLDILHALIRHILGQVDDSPEFRKIQRGMERRFHRQFPTRRLLDIVSTTRRWKIENNAALVIQRAWRAYLKRKYKFAEGPSRVVSEIKPDITIRPTQMSVQNLKEASVTSVHAQDLFSSPNVPAKKRWLWW